MKEPLYRIGYTVGTQEENETRYFDEVFPKSVAEARVAQMRAIDAKPGLRGARIDSNYFCEPMPEPPQYRSYGFFSDSSEQVELIVALDDSEASMRGMSRLRWNVLQNLDPEAAKTATGFDGLWQDGGYRVWPIANPDTYAVEEWERQAQSLVLAYFEAERQLANEGETLVELAEHMLDQEALEQAVTDALNALGQFADQLPRSHFVNSKKNEWTLLELVVTINNLQWAQISNDDDDFFENCDGQIEQYFERIRALLANQETSDAAQG